MNKRISVCNLGVDDLARARRFYEGMGFVARSESNDRAVFFELEWSWLALFTKPFLAEIAGTAADPAGPPAFCLSHFVREEADVDAVLSQAVEHGGSIVVEPKSNDRGRIGYFADPDGYRWEVAYQPYWSELAG